MGAIFLAHPIGDDRPKENPDKESLGAAWFTLDEIAKLPLRDKEALDIIRYVADGGSVYPSDVIDRKGWAARE